MCGQSQTKTLQSNSVGDFSRPDAGEQSLQK
jgi:hypothetical protein